ncbi:hypothetical protein CCR85_12210 [Rhodothalassium salexigens]|uniref:HlyD family type I secretion periplasmic adaptor subunit n=1 Tax=Rhodothalassium salexigens TaxID=1086 RepID=UPI001911660A|nr:HlyD family type I secretion periplasmic adaptor subunit [Rhodothalassium salexigens]MBK5912253.1 hypothetical protein [Rhodothalassium salexigens]MBK5921426.1 hypothetical protein [Rhodothalassium salexigens]
MARTPKRPDVTPPAQSDAGVTQPTAPAPKAGSGTLLSRADKAVLSRSVLLEETAPPALVHATIWMVGALLLAFIVWGSLTMFEERAQAPGEIVPADRVMPVQHLEGGIVADVAVEEGATVAAGDVLVRLNPIAARAEYEGLKARAAALGLQVRRLRAFALDEPLDLGPLADQYPDLAADQRRIFETQQETRIARTEVATSQIVARQEQLNGLKAREATLRKQIVSLNEEVELQRTLFEQGHGRKVTLLATERALTEAQGNLEQVLADQSRVEASIAEARSAKLETEERLRTDALDTLGTLAAQRAEVAERIRRLEDRFDRTDVRAPTAGLVNGLDLSPGQVVAAGDKLMEIVPQARTMVAKVRISPRDIGHVAVGQRALVRVDTYNFSRAGGIEGRVERISATSFEDEEGRPYFAAKISLDQNHVGNDPRSNRVTPGMTLTAQIQTGEKSLLAYLWRPVSQSLDSAFSER